MSHQSLINDAACHNPNVNVIALLERLHETTCAEAVLIGERVQPIGKPKAPAATKLYVRDHGIAMTVAANSGTSMRMIERPA